MFIQINFFLSPFIFVLFFHQETIEAISQFEEKMKMVLPPTEDR